MSAHYERVIRFADTDAASFVYFANYLSLCHEAYEDSLAKSGIELRSFFVANRMMIPVGKAQIQFLGGLQSGDRIRIELNRTRLSDTMFRVDFRIILMATAEKPEKLVALAQTEHVGMDLATLQRSNLPAGILQWLAAKPAPATA